MEPFSGPYHYNYVYANREWYDSFDRYIPDDELLNIVRATVPVAWRFQRNGIWVHAQPPGVELPEQGWKIHVSATPRNGEAVLKAAARVCVAQKLAFKFNADLRILSVTNGKIWGRGGAGKFITIYPIDEQQFRTVMEVLYEALKQFHGPYILSDKRYKDASVLYYRYGGIQAFSIPTVEGSRAYRLRSPSGQLVPDQRGPVFSPPDWATDPFPSTEEEEDDGEGLKDGRYRIDRVLTFSVVGGVYAATDLDTGSTVLIKEARPHVAVDRNGLSATDRLQKEYRLLQKLGDTGVAPRPIDLFWEWEHLFLVEEFIAGSDLAKFTVTESPITKGVGTQRQKDAYFELFQKAWVNLAKSLQALHERNIVFGDLSLHNVMLTDRERGALRLIDLEGAWEIGVDQPSPWFGTPGCNPPGGTTCKEDDYYSLGAVMLGMMWPYNSFFDGNPSAYTRFVEALGTDLGLPASVRRLVAACMDSERDRRPTPAQVVEVLSDRNLKVEVAPTAVQPIPRGELLTTVDRTLAYIRGSASYHRDDMLFPADPYIFESNPLSLSFGAVGVAYALQRIAGEVPAGVKSWILARPARPEQYPPGLYVGSAGVAWGLWEIGLHDVALQTLRSADDHPLLWQSSDLFYGAAGYGLTALRFYRNTGDRAWLEKAVAVGEKLLAKAERRAEGLCWPDAAGNVWLGQARGAAGIALFLLYLTRVTGEQRYLEAGRAGLDFDLAFTRPIPEGPLALLRGPVGKERPKVLSHFWWDGSAGLLTTLVRYWAVTREPRHKAVIDQMAPDLFRRYTSFPSLVRGLSGLGNCLLDLHDFTGEEIYLDEAHRVASGIQLLAMEKPAGIAFPGEQLLRAVTDYGSGSAGVALYLHRLANAAERPGNFNFTLDELLGQR